jgi:predicted RND superfamily exporter protein
MVIFIVLGISADDIFVIVDSWRQSEHIPEYEGNYRKRMSYAFKRSAVAIAVTSSTTCVAFLANSFSSIMPIRAFGIYAGIIVPVNYLLTSLLMPPMIIIHDKYLKGKCRKQENFPSESAVGLFFEEKWNWAVRYFRWLIVIIFLCWTGFACSIAKDISPLTKMEKFFKDDHYISQVEQILSNEFSNGNLFNINVNIYWGVKGINK